MTLIKVCGITNMQDAQECAANGVDYAGLIFADSARKVDVRVARQIVSFLRPAVKTVAVFRNQPLAEVRTVCEQIGTEYVQLHGSESADYCASVGLPVIKAVELGDPVKAVNFSEYENCMLLFDRPKSHARDNWLQWALDWLCERRTTMPPFFFAGGLSVDNITEVLSRLQPWAVDVASGVEFAPGRKDAERLREFCACIREVSENAAIR